MDRRAGREEQIAVTRVAVSALLCLGLLALAACGPALIKGRPPFVDLSGMTLSGDRLDAEFGISNQNGIPMTLEGISIAVVAEEAELLREDRATQIVISANSTEEFRSSQSVGTPVLELLKSLQKGDRQSLPFDLTGSVQTSEDGKLVFEQKGYLYPVPGRPGHYRSAVTRARGLQREELP
jgi:hypothetical protein